MFGRERLAGEVPTKLVGQVGTENGPAKGEIAVAVALDPGESQMWQDMGQIDRVKIGPAESPPPLNDTPVIGVQGRILLRRDPERARRQRIRRRRVRRLRVRLAGYDSVHHVP